MPNFDAVSPSNADHAVWLQDLDRPALGSHDGLSVGRAESYFHGLFSDNSDESRLNTAKTLNRQLGPVLLSSGMTEACLGTGCRLDWAIIDVTNRFSTAMPSNVSQAPHATFSPALIQGF